MKIMMTGGSGKIGTELREYGVIPLKGDITKPWELDDSMSKESPDIIVHLAAVSNVDFCEKPDAQSLVIDVNLRGTYNLLTVAEKYNVPVVMLSTDHVFSGGNWLFHKSKGYSEKDKPDPINFYGKSKYAAEALMESFPNLKVIRASYLFDKKRLEKKEDSYPTFIYRSFMYLPHFVGNLYMYLSNFEKMPRLLHISGSVVVSWYEFMRNIVPNAKPREKDLENGYAPRPKWGGLRTNYKLLPSYSYLDGIEDMNRK